MSEGCFNSTSWPTGILWVNPACRSEAAAAMNTGRFSSLCFSLPNFVSLENSSIHSVGHPLLFQLENADVH